MYRNGRLLPHYCKRHEQRLSSYSKILDQHGNLMKYLDGCGLYEPSRLSIDAVGRLWVGLPVKREIKVIEY